MGGWCRCNLWRRIGDALCGYPVRRRQTRWRCAGGWFLWLYAELVEASAPQESMFGETLVVMPASAEFASMPDWLNSIQSVEPEFSSKPADAQPTFADNSGGNIDELFTDLPDWLSNAGDTATPVFLFPGADHQDPRQIAPCGLPSWVQAMRPVDFRRAILFIRFTLQRSDV